MTKEELKKEAEENSFRYTLDKPWVCEVERKQIMAHFEKGYLAGAEPREKRIEELEVTNKKISDECHKLVDSLEKKQKEIAELKAHIDKMKYALNKIIKTVHNDNISGYGDRLVMIYDISCEVLQEIEK